jgi:hypothetical protein
MAVIGTTEVVSCDSRRWDLGNIIPRNAESVSVIPNRKTILLVVDALPNIDFVVAIDAACHSFRASDWLVRGKEYPNVFDGWCLVVL